MTWWARWAEVAGTTFVAWHGGTRLLYRLRRERLITCRDEARVLLWYAPAVDVGAIVGMTLWVGSLPAWILVVAGYLSARSWRLCDVPRWRAHRDHDEDCQFGPRRHPFRGRRPRLVVFAPPAPLTSPA